MTDAASRRSIADETDVESGAGPSDAPDAKSASPLSGPLGLIVALILLSTAGYLSYKAFTTSEPVPLDTPPVIYICAETGKTYPYQPKVGDKHPVMSPYSHKRTGYPAEACYWADRDEKKQRRYPVYVLLNQYIGKEGPTTCPDCGHVVLPHNPLPPRDVPYELENAASSRPSPTTQPAGDDD